MAIMFPPLLTRLEHKSHSDYLTRINRRQVTVQIGLVLRVVRMCLWMLLMVWQWLILGLSGKIR